MSGKLQIIELDLAYRDELRARIVRKTLKSEEGCWLWLGEAHRAGYGATKVKSKTCMAHRVAYAAFIGPLCKGAEVDHLCRNRCCVNPWHLELVSHRENVVRSDNFIGIHARKTHCVHGHELSEENIYRRGARRVCRRCHSRRTVNSARRRRAKLRQKSGVNA